MRPHEMSLRHWRPLAVASGVLSDIAKSSEDLAAR
jgi:hypothetical protein